MAAIDTILKFADVISEIRRAFAKIENLESGQKYLADALSALDKRVRELEAGLREAKAEIKFEAIKETQSIVNSVQGHLYQQIREVSISLDRLSRNTLYEHSSGGSLNPPDST
jgi:predicted RNase H-like nuclease (RuvC/YqgF family)